MHCSSNDPAAMYIFARWTVVAGRKGPKRIAHAIDVVEEFSKHATPGLGLRERVVCDEVEASRYVALKMQEQSVVTGPIVRVKDIHIGHEGGLVRVTFL